jgi:hypothetical protein
LKACGRVIKEEDLKTVIANAVAVFFAPHIPSNDGYS